MILRWLLLVLAVISLNSFPLSTVRGEANSPSFRFPEDAPGFANELTWEYQINPATGRMTSRPRVPTPSYRLHCVVLARTTWQFYEYARFEPAEPKSTRACYRHLIKAVLARSPRHLEKNREKIVIPGYANLREFSLEQEALLKAESGSAWQSYLQRGNWRMVFPFSRRHQQRMAESIARQVQTGRPAVVHLVCFPSLALNHTLLVFDVERTPEGLQFAAYDPNQPSRAALLFFNQDAGRFSFPPSSYFAGGPVKVYQLYKGWLY
jgi:hypothetical protein